MNLEVGDGEEHGFGLDGPQHSRGGDRADDHRAAELEHLDDHARCQRRLAQVANNDPSRAFGLAVRLDAHHRIRRGALEAWLSIERMNNDWYAPTLNLDVVDPRCAELDYLRDAGRTMQHDCVMSNNFAFGGINTSLIMKRVG